jgi:diguanylate cyclase (GGDEF)-like protein
MSEFAHPAEQPPLQPYFSDATSELFPAAAADAQSELPATTDHDTRRQALLDEARAVHGDLGSREDWMLAPSPEMYIMALTADRDRYRHLAEHDMLTGLVNKETWRDLLRTRLELNQPTGVVMLDLNSFKAVNDNLGHETGDTLLADFGTFLRGIFKREEDLITETDGDNKSSGAVAGRDGGDEFRILIDLSENNRRGEEPHARMDRAYEYLQEKVAEFVAAQPETIRALGFNAAIGAAVSNPNSQQPVNEQLSVLLQQADESMYEDKPENSRR